MRKKYGERNVAQIITFGTMASKGVVRDVARALGMEYSYADSISKLIPVHQGKPMPLDEALEKVPELREMAESGNPEFTELIKHAKVLEGLVRHASVHAAGIIIAPDEITNYVPLYQVEEKGEKVITTQFTMVGCETIGLLKMDFLGLRTLTVLHHAVEMIRKKGVEIDLDKIPLDDQETYQLFSEGNTVGIFQFESSGMQEYLRKLKPNRIEDLIAMNALYRPGPMENIDSYIARKYGREKIEYLHPKLEPILKETYGSIVYQEQVMRIASDLAGFSLGKADILRRAMGKKKKEVMEKLRVEFIEGCLNNGIDRKTAEDIYELIFKFASYGFNKSHSAAYAILAYQTAYLKRHYPAEFMAATLTSEINDSSRIVVLIEECRHMGLEILPPDVNRSGADFEVPEPGKISFGLAAIKNVGRAAIQSIIRAREEHGPFKNIFHFLQHVDSRAVNKKILEALIQAGALDSLEGTREQNFAAIETALNFAQKYNSRMQNKSQISLFELLNAGTEDTEQDNFINYPSLPVVPEWSIQEKLEREKELLGFYISGHPLDKFASEIKLFSNLDWNRPETFAEGKVVKAGAIITNVKHHLDTKGNLMAFITLEDRRYSFEGVVFASVFEKYGQFVNKGEMVFVSGRVTEQSESSFKMLCDEIIPLAEVRNRHAKGVSLIIDIQHFSEENLDRLQTIIKKYPGPISLFFEMRVNGNSNGNAFSGGFLMRSKKYKVLLSDAFLQEVKSLLGDDSVKIKD